MYILEPLIRLIWPLPKICKAPELTSEEVAEADATWLNKRMRPFKRRGRTKEFVPREPNDTFKKFIFR